MQLSTSFELMSYLKLQFKYPLGMYEGGPMLSSFLLSVRESLEASLIIGIILVYLTQNQRSHLTKTVLIGALSGLGISILTGFLSFTFARTLEGRPEELFEGTMMLVSAGLIAYFIAWLGAQSRNISSSIRSQVDAKSGSFGLFILAFVSVFREGLELSVFTLTKLSESAGDVAIGTVGGILVAVVLAFLIFKSSLKFNLKWIFRILGVLLIFIGAEMFAEGLMEYFHYEESLEVFPMALYLISSLFFLFRDSFQKKFRSA